MDLQNSASGILTGLSDRRDSSSNPDLAEFPSIQAENQAMMIILRLKKLDVTVTYSLSLPQISASGRDII